MTELHAAIELVAAAEKESIDWVAAHLLKKSKT